MGTRSGDLDPAILFYLGRQSGLDMDALDKMLNKQSGLKGICGENDMRTISQAAEDGDQRAKLARNCALEARKFIASPEGLQIPMGLWANRFARPFSWRHAIHEPVFRANEPIALAKPRPSLIGPCRHGGTFERIGSRFCHISQEDPSRFCHIVIASPHSCRDSGRCGTELSSRSRYQLGLTFRVSCLI